MDIDKELFEKVLPVGASSNENVFNAIKPEIDQTVEFWEDSLLGDVGKEIVNQSSEDSKIYFNFAKLCVCSAFLNCFRQLDLVLTPTGFGVVNNSNLTPASKQRVDSLENSLRTAVLKAKGSLMNALRGENWGTTYQAHVNIKILADEHWFFFRRGMVSPSYIDWESFQTEREQADKWLRTRISNGMMDEFLDTYRQADSTRWMRYDPVIRMILDFFRIWSTSGQKEACGLTFRGIVWRMERGETYTDENGEEQLVYSMYLNSMAYKLNHDEVFKNTKKSTGYIFNG